VAAGPACGRGPMADPAPRRLGLGCPAMRTTPHRHGADGSCDGRRCRGRLSPDRAADPTLACTE
jgi:hypothetical protein